MAKCRICKNETNNKIITCREMMNGAGEEFDYFICSACGCMQIGEYPANIVKYYENYYTSNQNKLTGKNIIRSRFKKLYAFLYITLKLNFIRALYAPFPFNWLDNSISLNARILDVGCGNGNFLYQLYQYGFNNLIGIDPFQKEYIQHNQLKFINEDILQHDNGTYDFIFFNHSFEHIWEQKKVLSKANSILNQQGKIVLRIPVKGIIFDIFKSDWVQIDPPRHFYLHTIKSIKLLAKDCGLRITKTICDSTIFQLLGSESYRRNIPLNSARFLLNRSDKIGKKKLRHMNMIVKILNEYKLGDQFVIYMEKMDK
ncbi:MAG: class I SAM-dependent methyltransferase [Bacteroidales bacterium]